MRKRLQVQLAEEEYREIQAAARREGLAVSEWVRKSTREARKSTSRLLTQNSVPSPPPPDTNFPTADISDHGPAVCSLMNLLRRGRSLLVSRKSWIRASTVLADRSSATSYFRDCILGRVSRLAHSQRIRQYHNTESWPCENAAGLIALPLALWRGHVAEQQANAAQQSLRNERYQKGAEMLGSEVLSVRLGGIYGLQQFSS